MDSLRMHGGVFAISLVSSATYNSHYIDQYIPYTNTTNSLILRQDNCPDFSTAAC